MTENQNEKLNSPKIENNSQNANKTKKCNKCFLIFPINEFYRRKDRQGNYTWRMSYCKNCMRIKKNESVAKNRKYYNDLERNRYTKIERKFLYFRKLSKEKKKKYLRKLEKKKINDYQKLLCEFKKRNFEINNFI